MDKKKTYFNSIMSKIKPKFKYTKRQKGEEVDEYGASVRQDIDLSSLGVSSRPTDNNSKTSGRVTAPGGLSKTAKKHKKSNSVEKLADQKHRIRGIIAEFFAEKSGA